MLLKLGTGHNGTERGRVYGCNTQFRIPFGAVDDLDRTSEKGSGYVPLDPNYPPDRIDYMLRDSGAQILVTETALISQLPVEHVTVVKVDEALHIDIDAALRMQDNPNSLAYQIYTSGSTGLPKGVQIDHRAVLNFLC